MSESTKTTNDIPRPRTQDPTRTTPLPDPTSILSLLSTDNVLDDTILHILTPLLQAISIDIKRIDDTLGFLRVCLLERIQEMKQRNPEMQIPGEPLFSFMTCQTSFQSLVSSWRTVLTILILEIEDGKKEIAFGKEMEEVLKGELKEWESMYYELIDRFKDVASS
jgi:hypothetical protein